jgi:hypothetical protein
LKKNCIGFLHTSQVHINTFSDLCDRNDSSVEVIHLVKEELLARAQRDGLTQSIRQDTQALLAELVNKGADVVVCTCSSIGSVAEEYLNDTAIFQRIDRAMADLAVSTGTNLLILAAVDSTLAPTKQLVEQSAQMLGKSISISTLKVDNAWQYFESGDLSHYHQMIAAQIKHQAHNYDVIVLAQASMAGATQYCASVETPILSSPELGVLAAISTLNQ